jgi:PAS domain S-box-containing protein
MATPPRMPVGAQEDATESEQRFRLLVESVTDYAIFMLDLGGRITSWNRGAERINGYSADEIIGKHFSIFYPPEDGAAGKTERELEIATRTGRFEEEGWRIRKDGSRLWANVTITAMHRPDGVLVGFAKLTRDLTERRQAEEETRRFRLLVESVKDYAIFILDPGGHVLTWNLGAERIKGYSADEIIGKHFSIFYPPEDVAAGTTERELEIATRTGRFEEEGWRIRRDGSRFWANVTITALRNPDGSVMGFAKVTRDLTERRKAEETQRALAAEKAALAEKSRIQEFQERFLAILGHDLRNPLSSIDVGAGILRQRSTDPTQLRILARMRSSSLRMARMIEQIMDLTRARLAGGIELNRRPTDLCDILERVVEELRLIHPSRTIELRCIRLPGTWDPDRLEQVFSNLVANALVHGDREGPVTIEGRVEGRVITIAVHNQGKPIPNGLQATIFNPFRRGEHDGPTAKASGLGLGLYISRRGCRSAIQRRRRNDVSSDPAGYRAHHSTIGKGAMTHTVLVVEDEQDLREMIRDALELNGYAVVTAEDGQDALGKIDDIEKVCLVILDLLMPVMNGWDFIHKLRQRSELAAVPIVVHTSAPGPAPAGVARVLQKPLLFERLLSVVRDYCAQ